MHLHRKIILLAGVLILFCLGLSCNNRNHQKTDFKIISIKIDGYENAGLTLYQLQNDSLLLLDSALIRKSSAVLVGKIEQPQLLYVFINGLNDYIPVFVDDEKTEILVNTRRPDRSEVLGSETHSKFIDFLQSFAVYNDKMLHLKKQFDEALQNKDMIIVKQIDSTKQILESEKLMFLKKYVSSNNHSIISAYVLQQYLIWMLKPGEINLLYKNFYSEVKDSYYGKEISTFLEQQRKLDIGKPLPPQLSYYIPDSVKVLKGRFLVGLFNPYLFNLESTMLDFSRTIDLNTQNKEGYNYILFMPPSGNLRYVNMKKVYIIELPANLLLKIYSQLGLKEFPVFIKTDNQFIISQKYNLTELILL